MIIKKSINFKINIKTFIKIIVDENIFLHFKNLNLLSKCKKINDSSTREK
jgi:hypothetical protein